MGCARCGECCIDRKGGLFIGGTPEADWWLRRRTNYVRTRPDECRSAYRQYENPGYTDVCFGKDTHGFVGFRCVRRSE